MSSPTSATSQRAVDDELYRLRHSLAHVLAMAVQELRPGTQLGFGPPIEDGFYYDFVLSEPLNEEHLDELEHLMRTILERDIAFEREELPAGEALARLEEMGEPYKREYAEELVGEQNLSSLSFYRSGDFVDLCRGPHVERTSQVPREAFKLRSVGGVYWRGEEDSIQMTRIYGWAFASKDALDARVERDRRAIEHDHKKLGQELDLYVVDELVGPGLPLWLPKGTVLRDELEKLARELEFEAGYQRVATPQIAKTELYHRSGHLPYYADHMYPFMALGEAAGDEGDGAGREEYVLRPMNCPHHHRIFSARPRSHRELPLRLAEYGTVYRYEDHGALSGLLRVRGMTMNDAHIYCTEEQITEEFIEVIRMHQRVYEILEMRDFHLRFSTWDPATSKGQAKYVDNPAAWEKTQGLLRAAMERTGVPFVEARGEAAFYGPKVDVQIRTVTGREETASTTQLDFAQPERMGLTYQGADNADHRPYVIHRAPLGTHERFVAFLIEHYGGAFPTWLAPVQVRILTVSQRFADRAQAVARQLRADGVRVDADPSNETLGKAIRQAAAQKIPNVLVIGEREVQDDAVTLRRHGVGEQETIPVEVFRTRLARAISERSRIVE